MTDAEGEALDALIDEAQQSLLINLDELERWHDSNGSLYSQVG